MKIIKVEKCAENVCPYFYESSFAVCDKENRVIMGEDRKNSSIPSWCPLEDLNEEQTPHS